MPMKAESLEMSLVEEEEIEYDSPEGSVWTVAIDMSGHVTILVPPNIHYSYFDCGTDAESIGLPFECEDKAPGVYRWTVSVVQGYDEFSGEYWGPEFSVEKEEILWQPEE
jgi:hypothetical protein